MNRGPRQIRGSLGAERQSPPGTEPSLGLGASVVVIGALSTLSWAFVIVIAQFLWSAL